MMRNVLSIAIALTAIFFALVARAQSESPQSCSAQNETMIAAMGTGGFAAAKVGYETCEAIAIAQEKKQRVDSRYSWAASLDKLPEGGWALLSVSPEGMYAVFGSRRHAAREGSVVTVWTRTEYREEQSIAGETVKSSVERTQYDCVRAAVKEVSVILYSENNLAGTGASQTFESSKAAWSPAIPGSLGEELLDWACKVAFQSTKAP